MDIAGPLTTALANDSISDRSSGLLHLPPTFLDAIIPGYSVLADTVLRHVGIDISFYVSLCALIFALHAAWNFTMVPLYERARKACSSYVVIEDYDNIFDHVLDWARAHRFMTNVRALRVESRGRRYYDDDEGEALFSRNTVPGDGTIFNFNSWAARAPPKYSAHSSSGFFWHNGYLFRITRERERLQSDWGPLSRDVERLTITVLWQSTAPIKALINEARSFNLDKQTSHTRIYRPMAREGQASAQDWHVVALRPSRPMSTVVLDDRPKAEILLDINEFLHPKTAAWYANRGIPYRRGYLFHGAPGTGKSSMSFSLAGVFGLNIYCLSLSEINLTEESLILLFNNLPKRCIVLLEDIDSAGISRRIPVVQKSKTKKQKSNTTTPEVEVVNPKRLINTISISGLLNAIDGVASQEGRVLIMTTNFPEKLDDALIRPGRVDMKIAFNLASRQQTKELYLRMYSADTTYICRQPTMIDEVIPLMGSAELDRQKDLNRDTSVSVRSTYNKFVHDNNDQKPDHDQIDEASGIQSVEDQLETFATAFANALPEDTFSPAEIQGYLLTRKKSPKKAVQEVAAWRDAELSKKRAKEDAQKKKTKDRNEDGIGKDADGQEANAQVDDLDGTSSGEQIDLDDEDNSDNDSS